MTTSALGVSLLLGAARNELRRFTLLPHLELLPQAGDRSRLLWCALRLDEQTLSLGGGRIARGVMGDGAARSIESRALRHRPQIKVRMNHLVGHVEGALLGAGNQPDLHQGVDVLMHALDVPLERTRKSPHAAGP